MAFSISGTSCEKHLNCSICMEVFSDPRALPCMHTFCQSCLQSYITTLNSRRDVNSQGFECPVCRQITKAPIIGIKVEEWASTFTPNYTVKGLVDGSTEATVMRDLHKRGEYDGSIVDVLHFCDVHSQKRADFKCENHTPVRVLCAVCAARKHKRCKALLYLGDNNKSSESEDDMEFNENIAPVVPTATNRPHTRHTFSKFRSLQTQRHTYDDCLTEGNKSFKTSFENNCRETRKNASVQRNSHKSLRRLVENPAAHSFDACMDLKKLSATATELVPTIDITHTESDHNSREQIAADSAMSISLESDDTVTGHVLPDISIEQTESHPNLRRLVRSTASHSFDDSDDMRRLSAEVNDQKKAWKTDSGDGHHLQASTSRTALTKHRKAIGLRKEMSVISEVPEDDFISPTAAVQKSSEGILSLKSNLTLSQEVIIKLEEDSKTCSITGICSMPDGRVLLADYKNYKVKMFDDNGMSKAYITLPSEPWDIDAVGDCEAVVSLPNAMCLFTLIIDTKITVGRRLDIDRKCYGVVFSNMEFFIACGSDVRIFNYNGEFLTRILKDRKPIFPNPRSLGSNLRYICLDQTNSNRMFISDQNRGVLYVSREGETISSHRCSNHVYPQGLTSSQSGPLVVCQMPNHVTVCVINEQGCRTKDILRLKNAQNVDFNKLDQRLWVSRGDCDSISIYTTINSR